jgi:hypothetical protein
MRVIYCKSKGMVRGSGRHHSIVHAGGACTLPRIQTARRGISVGMRGNVGIPPACRGASVARYHPLRRFWYRSKGYDTIRS